MEAHKRKIAGAFYTPDDVAASLVKWAVRDQSDCMLDPSCGDGGFLVYHRNSVGIEQDQHALKIATARAPWAKIHAGNFFTWAQNTGERYECAAGNPPFIRYQHFNGKVRAQALELCRRLGVQISSLASSWTPFLVVTASLLKPGGRMAFVVPAEIGHAPYAVPLMKFLIANFEIVHLIALQQKLFPHLSEDCWLLYANGYGASTETIRLTKRINFDHVPITPEDFDNISVGDWRRMNYRLRPFLLPNHVRLLYRNLTDFHSAVRLGDVAEVCIGYVTGANDFFHLRPSQAVRLGIGDRFLFPSVRNGRMLKEDTVSHLSVCSWIQEDEPILLLRIEKEDALPESVKDYLDSADAEIAKAAYKCRVRSPWYVVPDVRIPDAFLSYMSGTEPRLVANVAKCSCTNSVHAVSLKGDMTINALQEKWNDPLARLSCEIEGHPLGGGMLKLEPGEAKRVVISGGKTRPQQILELEEGIQIMRRWRHHA